MKNLLVPVDLSEISRTLIARAACLAQYCHSRVWLLHVISPDSHNTALLIDQRLLRDEAAKELLAQRHQLHDLATRVREAGITVFPYHKTGSIGKTILLEAQRVKADLIIIGTHGHGNLYHVFFGGVGQRVTRLSTCPVMIVSRDETRSCEFWKRKLRSLIGRERRIP